MPVAMSTLAAFGSFVRPLEGEPRDFEDYDWQSLGSTSNAENCTVAYDIFLSEGEDEEPTDRVAFGGPNLDMVKGESVPRDSSSSDNAVAPLDILSSEKVDNEKPSRKLFGDSCPGVVKGHNAKQGDPPLAEHVQPPTPFDDNNASIAGDPSEVPNRSPDLPAVQFEIVSSVDNLPNKAVGASEGSGFAKGSNTPLRCPTPNVQTKVPTANVDTGHHSAALDQCESPCEVGPFCSLPDSYRYDYGESHWRRPGSKSRLMLFRRIEAPSQLPGAHSDHGFELACRLPEAYRRLALQLRVFGNVKMRQVDLHMLALQEHFDTWKTISLRSIVSCSRANDTGALNAYSEGMISLRECLRVRLLLGQCHRDGTPDFVIGAYCFFRWQVQGEDEEPTEHYIEGAFDEVILAHCFYRWHAIASSAPSKPPKPAKRRARKKKR